jgi:F0F1-type ATP synthase assembly protein I|tara:strand:- start:1416 stop:1838 length:423 start_codon:yes stop_codon:yes gene_type:complete
MVPYDKDEGPVSDDDVFDGNPSSGEEKVESIPYAGAGAYQQPMMVQQSNDDAIFSMWLGISSWALWFLGFIVGCTVCLTPLTSAAGIVLGHRGFRASKEMNLGRNEAIAGLVMNYLSLLLLAGTVIFSAAILGAIGLSFT